jgi:hypothetical protein
MEYQRTVSAREKIWGRASQCKEEQMAAVAASRRASRMSEVLSRSILNNRTYVIAMISAKKMTIPVRPE